MQIQLRRKIRFLFWRFIQCLVAYRDAKTPIAKNFPVCDRRNYFYEPVTFNDRTYHTKFFLEKMANPLRIDFGNFKSEILPGTACARGGTHSIAITEPSVLPVCISIPDFAYASNESKIEISVNERNLVLNKLVKDRFYYVRNEEPGEIKVKCKENFIVGDPIATKQSIPTRRKLVLCLFIDSLTWEINNGSSFVDRMPNTAKFFSKGTVFENCYSWGNWTLTSAASIVSGLTIKNHGMFHPHRNDPLGASYKVLAEYFRESGYLTFQSCGNWRKTPRYGYVRGFNRSIYKAEMGIEETMYPFFDHLQAFPERSHFSWLSFNDAHHAMRLTPELGVQANLSPQHQNYAQTVGTYARDENRAARYLLELKKIDFHLGILFSYLEANYSDDELLVCLVSDHGIEYLDDNPAKLDRDETHTALMIRGGGVPSTVAHELVQNIDLLPSMLHLADIDPAQNIDGRLPAVLGGAGKRKTVASEILYPGVPYVASVKDTEFDFRLESIKPVNDDGIVDFSDYRLALYRGADGVNNVISNYPDIAARFERIAISLQAE